jgi:hypothetical protein
MKNLKKDSIIQNNERKYIHDTKKFGQLVKESLAKRNDIDKVYGDKAYDNRKNFNMLDDINAEPAISIRKNASTRSKGCPLRRDEVLLIKKLGYDGWKKQLKNTGVEDGLLKLSFPH